MPIKIPSALPARKVLEAEGVPLIKEEDAIRQDIRPLKVAVLNLMPEKIKTETQLGRVLGATPLQVEVTLLSLSSHTPKTTSEQHLLDFYHPWAEVKDQKFDGLIVTGAPIEKLPFEEVRYWDELCQIFDWSLANVDGLFNVAPFPHLHVLAESTDAGMALVHDPVLNHVHMFNHLEYDSNTLGDEYQRDIAKGSDIGVPRNYYPNDDPTQTPINTWRANAHILFGNWLNLIYQSTPYDMNEIGNNRPKVPGPVISS